MIKIYTTPSCSSCRKVKAFFNEWEIPFVEHDITKTPLEKKDILDILYKTENGAEDIISTRSKLFKEKKVDLKTMTLAELIVFIQENPTVLKRPIIVDERKMQVGYNAEEITVFIPREKREAYIKTLIKNF
jgi:regulatory protein spx